MGKVLVIKDVDFSTNYERKIAININMETSIESTTSGKYLLSDLTEHAMASYDIVHIPLPIGCTSIKIYTNTGNVAYAYFINADDKIQGATESQGWILDTTVTPPSGATYFHLSYGPTVEWDQYLIFSDGTHEYRLDLPKRTVE